MFPKYQEIQIPLLAELNKRGGQSRPTQRDEGGKTIYEALADDFGLSADLRSLQIYENDGTPRLKWENMVRWARNDLRKQGFLNSPSHGIWSITELGKKLLDESNKEKIGVNILQAELFVSPEEFSLLRANAEEIGRLGEVFVYEHEKLNLIEMGRPDLALKVRMISNINVAAGYDVLSFDITGREKYIEVKTTAGNGGSFEITANEISTAKKLRDDYWIYRVTKIRDAVPKLFKIQNPAKHIDQGNIILKPSSFIVTIGETYKG